MERMDDMQFAPVSNQDYNSEDHPPSLGQKVELMSLPSTTVPVTDEPQDSRRSIPGKSHCLMNACRLFRNGL
eukprot:m.326839 g.326839  ORF g.326839 m.326839 type:complete len:72 (+) comp16487_c0_seq4:1224-1439(+)